MEAWNMAVETKKTLAAEHNIALTNRSALSATGIEDVVCFTDEKIELKTNMGALIIKGSGLVINKVDTSAGNLEISGEVQMLEYSKKRSKEGFITSMFK